MSRRWLKWVHPEWVPPAAWAAWVTGVLAAGWIVLSALPHLLVVSSAGLTAAELAKAIADARTSIVQFLAGSALFGTLVYTARTFGLTSRGQLAERYTKSIDQVATKNSAVVIGGVYGLEQIVREDGRYEAIVVDVLASLVRSHASGEALDVAAEVQAALTVLGRRRTGSAGGVDLRGLHLNGVDLQDAHLPSVRLSRSLLEGAVLVDADLRGADLTGARLTRANLSGADLTNARLDGVDFSGAHLHGAAFDEESLRRIDMSRVASPP